METLLPAPPRPPKAEKIGVRDDRNMMNVWLKHGVFLGEKA
jgi:hypothetical protein